MGFDAEKLQSDPGVTGTSSSTPAGGVAEARERGEVYQISGAPHYMDPQPQAYYMWGFFPVEDKKTAKLTKVVLILSVFCGIMVLSSSILHFVAGSIVWGLLFLIIGILLLVCGAVGARRKNEGLLMCFAACNCVFVVFLIASFIFLLASLIVLVTTAGLTGCKNSDYFWIDGYAYYCRRVIALTSVQLVLCLAESIFYGFCFYYAYKLARRVSKKVVVTQTEAPPQLYGQNAPQPYYAQPVMYGQPAPNPISPAPYPPPV